MRRIFLLSLFVVCALCAPAEDRPPLRADQVETKLFRPTPINPDVSSDPKPKEKITLLNDDYTRKKRETQDKHVPSVLAATPLSENSTPKTENIPLREPYDDKNVPHKHTRDTEPKPLHHQVTPSYYELLQKEEELKEREHQSQKRETTSTSPAPIPINPAFLKPVDEQPEDKPKPQTLPALVPAVEGNSKPQTLPALLPSNIPEKNEQDKRTKRDVSHLTRPASDEKNTPQNLPAPLPSNIPEKNEQDKRTKRDVSHLTRPANDEKNTPQNLPAPLPSNIPEKKEQDQHTKRDAEQKAPQTLPAVAANTHEKDSQKPSQEAQHPKKEELQRPATHTNPSRPSRRPLVYRRDNVQRRPAPLPASTSPGTVNQAKKDDSIKKLRRDSPVHAAVEKREPSTDDIKPNDSKDNRPTVSSNNKANHKRETEDNKKSNEESPHSFVRPVPVSQVFGHRTSTTTTTTEKPSVTTEAVQKSEKN